VKVCRELFGEPRQSSGSHVVFKTPWQGDPRINLQNSKGQAKPLKTDHYTYRVTWSPEDEEHLGLCAEFPSLSWLAPTPDEALAGIRSVVAEVVLDMKEQGEPVPVPLSEKHYSGEFRIRIPPELHRKLAIVAAEQGVSLNRLVSAKLASL